MENNAIECRKNAKIGRFARRKRKNAAKQEKFAANKAKKCENRANSPISCALKIALPQGIVIGILTR